MTKPKTQTAEKQKKPPVGKSHVKEAEALASQIAQYWQERGVRVEAWVEPRVITRADAKDESQTAIVYVVNSRGIPLRA